MKMHKKCKLQHCILICSFCIQDLFFAFLAWPNTRFKNAYANITSLRKSSFLTHTVTDSVDVCVCVCVCVCVWPVFSAELDSQRSAAVHVTLPKALPHGAGHTDHRRHDGTHTEREEDKTVFCTSLTWQVCVCVFLQFLTADPARPRHTHTGVQRPADAAMLTGRNTRRSDGYTHTHTHTQLHEHKHTSLNINTTQDEQENHCKPNWTKESTEACFHHEIKKLLHNILSTQFWLFLTIASLYLTILTFFSTASKLN